MSRLQEDEWATRNRRDDAIEDAWRQFGVRRHPMSEAFADERAAVVGRPAHTVSPLRALADAWLSFWSKL